jgi:rhodanese-related sulfurtransferase
MKEHSTKGLLIAAIIFVVLLLAGFISLMQPGLSFTMSSQQTIRYILETGYEVRPEEVAGYAENQDPRTILLDLRNPYDFETGNIASSVNLPQSDLLKEESLQFFDSALEDALDIILISEDEAGAIGPWLLLSQLGYNNVKVMKGGWRYYSGPMTDPSDSSETTTYMVEEPAFDYDSIMRMMESSPAGQASDDVPEVVIPERRKKKNTVEGGC